MNITVLGKSPAWQDADGACSGYLVRGGGKTVLLDCGPGVFAKLRRHVDYVDVDAVVITHLHADHVLDLVPYASGLRYGPHSARPKLYAPPGALEAFAGMCQATNMTADHIVLAFDVTIYDPADTLAIGELAVRSEAETLPFPVNVEADYPEEMRLKYRFLDLRREAVHANIVLRSKVIASINSRSVPAAKSHSAWLGPQSAENVNREPLAANSTALAGM